MEGSPDTNYTAIPAAPLSINAAPPSAREPLSWAETGLFVGATLGPIYLGIRGALTDISIPLVGILSPATQAARGAIGAGVGLLTGVTWLFRAFEWIDAITMPRSEKDRHNRKKYPIRFGLLKYLPPISASLAVILVNAAEKTDGAQLFRPNDLLGLPQAEKIIVPIIYGGYLGATLAVRLGNALDPFFNAALFKNISWAECGLYLGFSLMLLYLEVKGLTHATLNVPMLGEINTSSTLAQGTTGATLGAALGLFWFYRLLETIDAWTLPQDKRAGAECRYGLLRFLPIITAVIAVCLTLVRKVSDGVGIFNPNEFFQFPAAEQAFLSFTAGAYVGATASVRFGNMADRVIEYFRGPMQIDHAREQSPVGLELSSPRS